MDMEWELPTARLTLAASAATAASQLQCGLHRPVSVQSGFEKLRKT